MFVQSTLSDVKLVLGEIWGLLFRVLNFGGRIQHEEGDMALGWGASTPHPLFDHRWRARNYGRLFIIGGGSRSPPVGEGGRGPDTPLDVGMG